MIHIKLSDNELMDITGGSSKLSMTLIVGGLIAFISGILDGYMNPKKCNNP